MNVSVLKIICCLAFYRICTLVGLERDGLSKASPGNKPRLFAYQNGNPKVGSPRNMKTQVGTSLEYSYYVLGFPYICIPSSSGGSKEPGEMYLGPKRTRNPLKPGKGALGGPYKGP